uniref:Uncharacterized protein n=1 Tax=Anguilla anguilla TaxID=7936 RepID=A0A0E9UHE6_ANGAN
MAGSNVASFYGGYYVSFVKRFSSSVRKGGVRVKTC